MVEMPPVGKRVRMVAEGPAGSTSHEGVVLPGAAQDHITIKLVNGYNVSYPLNTVTSIDEIGDRTPNTSSIGKVEQNQHLPKVTIIHTGGTIASKVDYATGAVIARFEPEELLSSVPEILEIANLDAVKLGNMWSDDIRPIHWNKMIDACQEAFDSGSVGVVITHGTDTLHISAAALSFAFAGNGGKPAGRIVFTGSQRSSDRASSDATENLLSAVYWAANGPEVTGDRDAAVTVMHAGSGDGVCAVSPGVGVRKMHSTKRDAFQMVNGERIGEITISRNGLSHTTISSTQNRSVETPTKYDTSIRIAQFLAGPHLHSDLLEAAESAGYSALMIHGTGLGHLPIENPNGDAPENDKLAEYIQSCSIPVIVANQCINGPIDLNVYSKGRNQQEIGILGHGTTSSPEALLAKVHWALSNGKDLKILSENLCGENQSSLRN
ncbi:MAG: Glu-tRNA(Gln) amidotransferase subunit GatD [Candidatus Poseidoniaceae archaeon]|nr:Glu-tRNA(Gln) amidotransferase subunit GatD [Candidatus Poseidoniaceae archaeon]